VVGDVFCGGKNTGCEVSGDVTLKMTGGTVDGKIYVGGNAENQLNNIVTSLKVSITVSGGKIGGIVGNLKNSTDPEAIYIEELEIDLTAYQPSSAAGWKEANISEMPTYAKVWLYGEDKTALIEYLDSLTGYGFSVEETGGIEGYVYEWMVTDDAGNEIEFTCAEGYCWIEILKKA
jgi:hypothetical protein